MTGSRGPVGRRPEEAVAHKPRTGNSAGADRTSARYQVYRAALPDVCATDPALMVFTADADGRCEVFTWDAATGRARQVTDRQGGTPHGTIDPDAYVWWFDEDVHGEGHWRFQPFQGGPDRLGLTGVPPGTSRGLAVGDDGSVAMGVGNGSTTTIHRGVRGGPACEVTRVDGHVTLSGVSPRAGLLAISGPAGSDRAVTVLTADGTPHTVLSGASREHHGRRPEVSGAPGAYGRLWSLGFAPRADRDELLLVREAGDRYLLACWSPGTGVVVHDWCAFDTEITARWYPDGRTVLIRQDSHGRSVLHRARPADRTLTRLPTPPGSLLDAAPRAGGDTGDGAEDIHYLWTDTAHPPRMHSTAGTALPPLSTIPGQVPGDHRDIWTPGPDGPVHTLLSLPALPAIPAPAKENDAPAPAVFLVHGGPADHDRDAYDGVVHSLVASGFAVARVNYRGSTGYGPRWRRAFGAGVGLTQVDDLVAVRADLIARGLVRADAVGLWGTSWGGYLVLLALGARPELWQAGVAVKPVADSVAAYRTTTPALRALDERLFGGSPDEVPERYARSSPVRYADRVRAPLLVVAATRDAKCPPGQVRGYLAALRAAGARHESMWLDTGHDGYEGGDHVAVLRRAMVFLDRELRRRDRDSKRDRTSARDRTPKTPPSGRREDPARVPTGPVVRAGPAAGTGTAEHV
ncbi:alpha/beta hydrolase family protein [Streptomyces sp. NPDC059743]|uniref:S9 family peptidase n=1 Tax=Streptomyces sp. NPDC059743 TaxID=3346928 RepID=UPI00364A1801